MDRICDRTPRFPCAALRFQLELRRLNFVAYPSRLYANRGLETESGGASTGNEDAATLFNKLSLPDRERCS